MNSAASRRRSCRLGELVENLDSRRVPVREQDRNPGPYPYYGASGVIDWVDDYLFEGEHLLVAEDGENLRSRKTPIAFIADGRYWVNNHAHVLRGIDGRASTRFLAYALETTDIAGYLTGSTQPKLTKANLEVIELAVPSFDEQVAIAALLGSLDAKIDFNRSYRTSLERLASELYGAWFVDFEYAAELVDSSAGPLPESWSTGRLSDIAVRITGPVNPSRAPDEVFEHFSIPAFDKTELPELCVGASILSSKTRLADEAILVSKLNPQFKRVWDARPGGAGTAVCSTEFVALHPQDGVPVSYLHAIVRFDDVFAEHLRSHTTGTTGSRQRVSPGDVLSAPIVVPSTDGLVAYDRLARPIFDRLHAALVESASLAELRDALMPKLISGELEVTDDMLERWSSLPAANGTPVG
jgi:type I restriction enzyme, S subunit